MSRATQLLLVLALTFIVLAGLHLAAPFLSAFLVGLVLAQVMAPMVGALRRRGWPNGAALATVILTALVGGGALAFFVALSLAQVVLEAPKYADRLVALADGARAAGVDAEAIRGALMTIVAGLVPAIGEIAGATLLAFLLFAFMVYEGDHLPSRIRSAGPRARTVLQAGSTYNLEVRRFLIINGVLGSLCGALIAVFLWLVGVDFALLWGILVALLTFVPAIGLLLAAIPPIVLAYLQFGPLTALVVIAGFAVITNVVAQFMKPKAVGDSLNLSRLVIILSVVLWGGVLGPVGGLFAVPLTLLVKAILGSFEETQWLAVLMSGQPAATEAVPGVASVPADSLSKLPSPV